MLGRASDIGKLIGAVAVAVCYVAIVGALVGICWMVLPYAQTIKPSDVVGIVAFGFGLAIMIFPFAAVAGLIIGIPIFWTWDRLGFTSFRQYVLAGIALSLICGTVVSVFQQFSGFLQPDSDFHLALTIVAICGQVAALTVSRLKQVPKQSGSIP